MGVCPRGATWSQSFPYVCVQKGRKWVLFRLQLNEMNEKMSFKMGVKFGASFYMGTRSKLHWVRN